MPQAVVDAVLRREVCPVDKWNIVGSEEIHENVRPRGRICELPCEDCPRNRQQDETHVRELLRHVRIGDETEPLTVRVVDSAFEICLVKAEPPYAGNLRRVQFVHEPDADEDETPNIQVVIFSAVGLSAARGAVRAGQDGAAFMVRACDARARGELRAPSERRQSTMNLRGAAEI